MTTRERRLIRAVADELFTLEGCYCDEPPVGESGTIECTPCRDNRLAKALCSLLGDKR